MAFFFKFPAMKIYPKVNLLTWLHLKWTLYNHQTFFYCNPLWTSIENSLKPMQSLNKLVAVWIEFSVKLSKRKQRESRTPSLRNQSNKWWMLSTDVYHTHPWCCQLTNNVSTLVIFRRRINWKETNGTLIILTQLDSCLGLIPQIYPINIAERLSFVALSPSPLSIWCCDVPCCELHYLGHTVAAACGEM